MKKNNIIAFERGAEFYFDLGYRKIQKGNLKSALTYIEKAVKLKPNDGFIQFNYAGLLAELGNLDLSTEVLLHIVEKLDPNYDECYFGLGCNFLQMQKIKKSVEYFSKYLDKDPEGEFSEEAEDLLEMLTMIKDANNNLDDEELEKIYKVEEEAINHLELREYKEAAEKFEIVVNLLPNAVPARNNLSLAYYYLGETQKAIDLAREVLNYEKNNVHANCNIAIFYNKFDLSNWVEKQIKSIKKLNTENPEYLYKIADTLGCLDKHDEAYKVYKRLLSLEPHNTLYYHYTAVAAYNAGRFNESMKYWRKLAELDKQNLLSDYYINLAHGASGNEEVQEENHSLSYAYQLPKEEVNRRLAHTQIFVEGSREISLQMLNEKNGKEAIYFSICFDRLIIRKLVFDKIKKELMIESEDILRKYILRPEIDDEIKIEAVFLLDIIGAKQPYSVNFGGEILEITADPLSIDIYAVNEEWEDIIKKAHKTMKGQYKGAYKRFVENLWMSFIKYLYPDIPKTNNIDGWAAALEYVYCKLHHIKTTQEEIAVKYEVSTGSIREKYKVILKSIENRAVNKEKK
ncbi:MAG: repeat-containing protein [Clostridia bacterium]|jgi:tetratricopeptide (TPR) repeat protein|nr:repeat-containing protein [Clostridia bacterium]